MTLAVYILEKSSIHWILRWWHVVFGVTWIGILYYFNFVQVPSFAKMEPAHRSGAIDQLVPRALWYFRWAAMATAGTGIVMIGMYASDAYKGNAGISVYSGAILGLVMLGNVWLIIWPNQQKVIANARGLLAGQAADPTVGAAGRKALLASRTNAVFSIPMLMFMTGTQHFFGGADPVSPSIIYWIIFIAIAGALEASALGYIGGMEGPITKQIDGHPKGVGHIGGAFAVILLVVFLIL